MPYLVEFLTHDCLVMNPGYIVNLGSVTAPFTAVQKLEFDF